MATFTLAVPTTPSFRAINSITEADIINVVGGLTSRKETTDIWRRVVQNTKIPATLLFAFAGVSGFNPNFASGTTYGLMSVNTLYGATDPKTKTRANSKIILNYERQKNRMTSGETSAFKSIGYNYGIEGGVGSFPDVTETFLKNYEFNLLMGAIFLGQLIDGDFFINYSLTPIKSVRLSDSRNNLLLERIIVLYFNACNTDLPSVQMALSNQYTTALSLLQAIEGVDPNTASRIKQIMGVGGWIDSLKKSATFTGFVSNNNIR